MDLKKITDQHKFLILGLTAFCVLYLILYRQTHTSSNEPAKPVDHVQADTFIPAGYVLVPIQLENKQAIAGLVDQFAVVDLYALNTTTQLNELVAEKVKLLRAPLDPNQFAVLLKGDKARELLQLDGRFSVVLQNRHVISAVTDVQKTLTDNQTERLKTDAPQPAIIAAERRPLESVREKALSIMKVKVEYAR